MGAWGSAATASFEVREDSLGWPSPLGARAGYQRLLGLPGRVSAIWDQSETLSDPQSSHLSAPTERL